jgi:phospholipid/cholesterol/gamma-HCH transport system substrate-binding protein
MYKQRTIEVAVGIFMAAGLVALFFLAMQVSNMGAMLDSDSYKIQANFANIGSLKVRAPVKLAGVRIGRVETINLDQTAFEATVTMRINQMYAKIPADTFATILTAGLLGEQYIGLDPGGSENYLQNGDVIERTQSALVLEQMIGQFLFNKAGENNLETKSNAQ